MSSVVPPILHSHSWYSVLSWLLTGSLNKHKPAARRFTCEWWDSFTLMVSVWNSVRHFTYRPVYTKSCNCDRSGLSFSLNQITKDAHCLRCVHSELQMLRYCVYNSDLGRMQHDRIAPELLSSMFISITHPHMNRKKGLEINRNYPPFFTNLFLSVSLFVPRIVKWGSSTGNDERGFKN